MILMAMLLFKLFQVTAASSRDKVVAALNQPQCPAAVAAAANVIGDYLGLRDEESFAAPKRMAYATAGAISALVAAGTTHLNHAGVAKAVCRVFNNLALDDANKVRSWTAGGLFF